MTYRIEIQCDDLNHFPQNLAPVAPNATGTVLRVVADLARDKAIANGWRAKYIDSGNSKFLGWVCPTCLIFAHK